MLRILELSFGLSDIFPKSKVCVKTLLIFSNILKLKLPNILRRVRLSLTHWEQWKRKCSVDCTSFPQQHNGFNVYWKLCLILCYLKWIKPCLSKSCNKTNSSRAMTTINKVWKWPHEIKNIAFKNQKALRLSKMRIYVVPFFKKVFVFCV